MNHRFCNGEATTLPLCISPNRNRTPVVVAGLESAVRTVAGSSTTPVLRYLKSSEAMPNKE